MNMETDSPAIGLLEWAAHPAPSNADLELQVQELSAALERERLLSAELSHRVKNTIANALSLVDQSLRGSSSIEEGRRVVSGRLAALAKAHEQLARGEWSGITLSAVIDSSVGPFDARVRHSHPDALLTARAALDLSLVFHELATNAAKYGALSTEAGAVTVEVQDGSDGSDAADGLLQILWRETGGPHVGAPDREGFGTRLVRQLIQSDLHGECEFSYAPDGLRCSLRVPAQEALVPRQRR